MPVRNLDTGAKADAKAGAKADAKAGADADADTIAATFERLFGLLRRLAPADSMSLTAASTLRRLEQGGPLRLTELAGLEGVTQPAMTQLVSRLERDDLARRVADPVDGRVVLVQVTDAGRDALRQRRAARSKRLHELLAHLTPAERNTILAALPALDRLCELSPN